MKIVYCINSITTLGGIEKVTITKANALSEIFGTEVFIIVTDNKGESVGPLSPKVHVIDLDVNYYNDDWKSKLHVLKGIFYKRLLHRKRLKKTLNIIQPDIVISVGTSEKYMVADIDGKWGKIREFHFVRTYRTLHARSVFDKISAVISNFVEKYYLKAYDKIIVLTNQDKNSNWASWKNVEVIPNPVTFRCSKHSELKNKKVLACGRLEYQKGFDLLIDAWRIVISVYVDWHLDIYGEGSLRQKLENQIESNGLSSYITLNKATSNIDIQYAEHSIFVLSSVFEGWGLVLLEAMTSGAACVSYDCPCGPADMIDDMENGLLVKFSNLSRDERVRNLADAICYMIEHEDERIRMGKAAIIKAKQFDKDIVMSKWDALFKSLVEQQ